MNLKDQWKSLQQNPSLLKFIYLGTMVVGILNILVDLITTVPLVNYYLSLIPILVKGGQFWRLVTFPFVTSVSSSPLGILFFFFYLMLLPMVIEIVESRNGVKKTNIFVALALLLLIGYSLLTNQSVTVDPLILALIALAGFYNPNFAINFYFFIPIRGIYLGVLSMFYMFYLGFRGASEYLLLFLLVVVFHWKELFNLGKQKQRSHNFNKKVKRTHQKVVKHRCTTCGKTDLTDPDMEFRYCSKCQGNFEYCMEHIHNHEHRDNTIDFAKVKDRQKSKDGV